MLVQSAAMLACHRNACPFTWSGLPYPTGAMATSVSSIALSRCPLRDQHTAGLREVQEQLKGSHTFWWESRPCLGGPSAPAWHPRWSSVAEQEQSQGACWSSAFQSDSGKQTTHVSIEWNSSHGVDISLCRKQVSRPKTLEQLQSTCQVVGPACRHSDELSMPLHVDGFSGSDTTGLCPEAMLPAMASCTILQLAQGMDGHPHRQQACQCL